MRLFIAIDIPQGIRENVALLSSVLARYNLRPAKDVHITLAFLGERDDVEGIKDSLSKISFNGFALQTSSIGFFPSEKRIRVVWLGLHRDEGFFALQARIRAIFGHKEKFMPHITIARARSIIIKDAASLSEALTQIPMPESSFRVDRFYLYKSELTAQGPIHTRIAEYRSL